MFSVSIWGIGGGIYALVSAFLWALVTILYKKIGEHASPLAINFAKVGFSLLLFGILILLDNAFLKINANSLVLMLISGILGISLGDTFFFRSLMILGPRQALLITTLIPLTTVLMAVVFLRERPSLINYCGIILTIASVAWFMLERIHDTAHVSGTQKGLFYGLISVFCCSLAIIFSKIGIEKLSSLEATFLRQIGGMTGLLLFGISRGQLRSWILPFHNISLLRQLITASFLGVFLGTWFSLAALKLIDVSIATVLNSTSPLFVLWLSFLLLKEKISFRSIFISFVSILGIVLLFIK